MALSRNTTLTSWGKRVQGVRERERERESESEREKRENIITWLLRRAPAEGWSLDGAQQRRPIQSGVSQIVNRLTAASHKIHIVSCVSSQNMNSDGEKSPG